MEYSQTKTADITDVPEECDNQDDSNYVPQLRYQDQTPILKSSPKRSCASLILIWQQYLNQASISMRSWSPVLKSSQEANLKMRCEIGSNIGCFFKSLINQGLNDVNESVLKETKNNRARARKGNLKAVSEADLEDYGKSFEKGLNVTRGTGAEIERHISIAHWLSGRNTSSRPNHSALL